MAQVKDITQLLLHGQSPDAALRNHAETQLRQFQEQDYAGYLVSLCAALAGEDKPSHVRRLAGIILKNTLDAKEQQRKAELVTQWLAVDQNVKVEIRTALLQALHCEDTEVARVVSMVIAKIAAIELPRGDWHDVIPTLLKNMEHQPPSTSLKQCTLEALGYVCEEMGLMNDNLLSQDQVNSILTAVVQGMTKDEADCGVRLAATRALYNALEFAHNNFSNERERNYLMQVICEGTICQGSSAVREASFECLVKIGQHYYEDLPPYMVELYKLTVRAIQNDEEAVSKQAIEFWSTLCDEETAIREERESSGDESLVLHNFIKQACQSLVPVLLSLLSKQDEDQEYDENAWSLAMAAGTCLCLVSQCVGDDVVELVMPYVQSNIFKNDMPEDWRLREGATYAFGSILEGPSPSQLTQFVSMGFSFLLNATKDPDPRVRNTTAWTIGRIFEFVHGPDSGQTLISNQNLPQINQVLLESIQDEPHIANRVCYAINQLARGSKGNQRASLSPYFKEVVQALINTAFRAVQDPFMHTKLQNSAFEAINEMVRSSSSDCLDMVGQLVPLFIQKLGETFQGNSDSGEAREKQSELQGILCGCLTVVIHRLSEPDGQKMMVVSYSDQIMDMLLRVFALAAQGGGSVHEEAMLAVGALTFAVGRQFVKYMQKFFPFMEMGLQNHREVTACQSTVGTLSDTCRAMDEQIFPYTDKIMDLLSNNLASTDVNRNIKPQILCAFSDIAMAVGERFEKYLEGVNKILKSAIDLSMTTPPEQDEDFCDYNNQLRSGIIDAYSGILQGLGRQKAEQYLHQQSTLMVNFIGAVVQDKNRDEGVTKVAVGLLGDIASSIPSIGPVFINKPWIGKILQECLQSDSPSLKDMAEWAASAVGEASNTTATSNG
ncbi:hypothetical protein BSKO_12945 [Bryopsis sp. KO-2023]|nr:hypothetical protein BSKO_12945 [Bryopsis sp. KO-2023]